MITIYAIGQTAAAGETNQVIERSRSINCAIYIFWVAARIVVSADNRIDQTFYELGRVLKREGLI